MSKEPSGRRKVSHFIREWRKHRDMTQDALAERADLTSGAISQLENGLINYTQPTLEGIANALGCSPADLLAGPPGGDGAPPIRTEDEIRSMLRRIEGLSESDINATYGVIAMALRSTQGGPQSAADRGQSETSTRRHEPRPSGKRDRQPTS